MIAKINQTRHRLNAAKRVALNLASTRPVRVWPAYLVCP